MTTVDSTTTDQDRATALTSEYSRRWQRVSLRERCPVCNHPDWCSVAVDGAATICMRVASDQPTRNGGWLHRLNTSAARPGATTTPATTGPGMAPIARRDAAYRALLDSLGLSDQHREHLRDARGLPAEAVDLFATLPTFTTLDRLDRASHVTRSVDLVGVPGFYRFGRKGRWALASTPTGILVPALDRFGRVQALQIRADAPGPNLAPQGILITEGSLKGCIAAYRLDNCVLAVAGVANWRAVLPLLAGAPPNLALTVAFDSDAASNHAVWFARESLCLTLHQRDYRIQLATWDGARAKGIDDSLLAGLPVDVANWRPSLPPVCRPTRTAGLDAKPLTRPAAVPLRAGVA